MRELKTSGDRAEQLLLQKQIFWYLYGKNNINNNIADHDPA